VPGPRITITVPEELARENVKRGVDALLDTASDLDHTPLDPADARAARNERSRFATTRGFVLGFACQQLVERGIVAGSAIRCEVPYAEIALNAKDRLVGGTANANTIRGAWNEWTAQFPKGTRHPVQTGVHAVLLLRSAQGNDNLVGLDCEFRADDRAADVVIQPEAAAPVTPLEYQFLRAALGFFRSRSPVLQKKVLRLFSERRYLAGVIVALISAGWISYVILHGTTHAFHQDASKQGQLSPAHAPVGPPSSYTRQEGEAAGIVEIRNQPGAEELTYRPAQPPQRVRGDLSNIEYEWHIRDTAGHLVTLVTDEPRLRFPTTEGVAVEALFVHPREVIFGRANFHLDENGKVELLSVSGHPLTPPADAVFTADGVGIATSNSDPAAMTITVSQKNVPLLDKEALARNAGVKKFEYGGVLDAPVPLGGDVTWQECLTREQPSLKVLQCEQRTLITHEDDTIAERRFGTRGDFIFHAPRTIGGRPLSAARWSIRNLKTGEVTDAGEHLDLRWTLAPGTYSIGCAAMGMSVVKHHTTRAEMGKTHAHSRLLPYRALHTVVTVY
jgi:hypothetical protein